MDVTLQVAKESSAKEKSSAPTPMMPSQQEAQVAKKEISGQPSTDLPEDKPATLPPPGPAQVLHHNIIVFIDREGVGEYSYFISITPTQFYFHKQVLFLYFG